MRLSISFSKLPVSVILLSYLHPELWLRSNWFWSNNESVSLCHHHYFLCILHIHAYVRVAVTSSTSNVIMFSFVRRFCCSDVNNKINPEQMWKERLDFSWGGYYFFTGRSEQYFLHTYLWMYVWYSTCHNVCDIMIIIVCTYNATGLCILNLNDCNWAICQIGITRNLAQLAVLVLTILLLTVMNPPTGTWLICFDYLS